MNRHEYQAVHLADAVTAACSCRWVSAYAHAFDKYARPDWEFHAYREEPQADTPDRITTTLVRRT